MDLTPIELVGTRAKLVPLSTDHIPALLEAAQFPEIWQWFPWCPMTLESMTAFVETMLKSVAAGDWMSFVVIDQADGSIVGGSSYLAISQANRGVEIGGTWLTPRVWRTRINTECKYLLLKHAFESCMLRVQLKTDLNNTQSQRAIERLGAVREGVLRRHMVLQNGRVRDTVMYSVIDDEWPAVKARLEGMLNITRDCF